MSNKLYLFKNLKKYTKNKLFISLFVLIFIYILFNVLFDIKQVTIYQTTNPNIQSIENRITFNSNFNPDKYLKIDLGNSADIKNLYVKTGDVVNAGDVIAQLDDTSEKTSFNNAWATFNSLVRTRNGIRNSQLNLTSDIENLKKENDKNIQTISDIIKNDENITEEQKSILLQQLIFAENLSKLTTNLSNTVNSIDLGGVIQGNINSAYLSIQNAQKNIEAKKIKAPFSGTILFASKDNIDGGSNSLRGAPDLSSLGALTSIPGFDINSVIGNLDTSGSVSYSNNLSINPQSGNYIIIADINNINIFPKFKIKDFLKIQEGMKVVFKTPIDDIKINGVIEEKYNIPSSTTQEPEYYVKIKLDNESVKKANILPFGVEINGEILLEKRENIKTVPINTILSEPDSNYVLILNEDNTVKKEKIILGDQAGINVEIIGDVDISDNIIVKEDGKKTEIQISSWLKKLFNLN